MLETCTFDHNKASPFKSKLFLKYKASILDHKKHSKTLSCITVRIQGKWKSVVLLRVMVGNRANHRDFQKKLFLG